MLVGGGATIYATKKDLQVLPADNLISGECSNTVEICHDIVQIGPVLFMLIT